VLFDQVLPRTAEAYAEALSFLVGEHNATAAVEAWDRLIARDPHADWRRAFGLTDLLVAQDKFEEAGTVWRQAIRTDDGNAAGYTGNSLVYNGGFERDIAGGGFGWRQTDVLGAEFDYDTDLKHSGNRSARLMFDGTKNLSYQELLQYVLVASGRRYRFQGFMRTNEISTESGMQFEIVDPKDQANLDICTQNETGTAPWTLEQIDFTTGPRTRMIMIRIARKPSERLDNKIRGTVWIDDVSLVPLGGE
jgi:hypothetical protein